MVYKDALIPYRNFVIGRDSCQKSTTSERLIPADESYSQRPSRFMPTTSSESLEKLPRRSLDLNAISVSNCHIALPIEARKTIDNGSQTRPSISRSHLRVVIPSSSPTRGFSSVNLETTPSSQTPTNGNSQEANSRPSISTQLSNADQYSLSHFSPISHTSFMARELLFSQLSSYYDIFKPSLSTNHGNNLNAKTVGENKTQSETISLTSRKALDVLRSIDLPNNHSKNANIVLLFCESKKNPILVNGRKLSFNDGWLAIHVPCLIQISYHAFWLLPPPVSLPDIPFDKSVIHEGEMESFSNLPHSLPCDLSLTIPTDIIVQNAVSTIFNSNRQLYTSNASSISGFGPTHMRDPMNFAEIERNGNTSNINPNSEAMEMYNMTDQVGFPVPVSQTMPSFSSSSSTMVEVFIPPTPLPLPLPQSSMTLASKEKPDLTWQKQSSAPVAIPLSPRKLKKISTSRLSVKQRKSSVAKLLEAQQQQAQVQSQLQNQNRFQHQLQSQPPAQVRGQFQLPRAQGAKVGASTSKQSRKSGNNGERSSIPQAGHNYDHNHYQNPNQGQSQQGVGDRVTDEVGPVYSSPTLLSQDLLSYSSGRSSEHTYAMTGDSVQFQHIPGPNFSGVQEPQIVSLRDTNGTLTSHFLSSSSPSTISSLTSMRDILRWTPLNRMYLQNAFQLFLCREMVASYLRSNLGKSFPCLSHVKGEKKEKVEKVERQRTTSSKSSHLDSVEKKQESSAEDMPPLSRAKSEPRDHIIDVSDKSINDKNSKNDGEECNRSGADNNDRDHDHDRDNNGKDKTNNELAMDLTNSKKPIAVSPTSGSPQFTSVNPISQGDENGAASTSQDVFVRKAFSIPIFNEPSLKKEQNMDESSSSSSSHLPSMSDIIEERETTRNKDTVFGGGESDADTLSHLLLSKYIFPSALRCVSTVISSSVSSLNSDGVALPLPLPSSSVVPTILSSDVRISAVRAKAFFPVSIATVYAVYAPKNIPSKYRQPPSGPAYFEGPFGPSLSSVGGGVLNTSAIMVNDTVHSAQTVMTSINTPSSQIHDLRLSVWSFLDREAFKRTLLVHSFTNWERFQEALPSKTPYDIRRFSLEFVLELIRSMQPNDSKYLLPLACSLRRAVAALEEGLPVSYWDLESDIIDTGRILLPEWESFYFLQLKSITTYPQDCFYRDNFSLETRRLVTRWSTLRKSVYGWSRRVIDLFTLHCHLARVGVKGFFDAISLRKLRLGQLLPWSVDLHTTLVVGVLLHGYGNWQQIKNDSRLSWKNAPIVLRHKNHVPSFSIPGISKSALPTPDGTPLGTPLGTPVATPMTTPRGPPLALPSTTLTTSTTSITSAEDKKLSDDVFRVPDSLNLSTSVSSGIMPPMTLGDDGYTTLIADPSFPFVPPPAQVVPILTIVGLFKRIVEEIRLVTRAFILTPVPLYHEENENVVENEDNQDNRTNYTHCDIASISKTTTGIEQSIKNQHSITNKVKLEPLDSHDEKDDLNTLVQIHKTTATLDPPVFLPLHVCCFGGTVNMLMNPLFSSHLADLAKAASTPLYSNDTSLGEEVAMGDVVSPASATHSLAISSASLSQTRGIPGPQGRTNSSESAVLNGLNGLNQPLKNSMPAPPSVAIPIHTRNPNQNRVIKLESNNEFSPESTVDSIKIENSIVTGSVPSFQSSSSILPLLSTPFSPTTGTMTIGLHGNPTTATVLATSLASLSSLSSLDSTASTTSTLGKPTHSMSLKTVYANIARVLQSLQPNKTFLSIHQRTSSFLSAYLTMQQNLTKENNHFNPFNDIVQPVLDMDTDALTSTMTASNLVYNGVQYAEHGYGSEHTTGKEKGKMKEIEKGKAIEGFMETEGKASYDNTAASGMHFQQKTQRYGGDYTYEGIPPRSHQEMLFSSSRSFPSVVEMLNGGYRSMDGIGEIDTDSSSTTTPTPTPTFTTPISTSLSSSSGLLFPLNTSSDSLLSKSRSVTPIGELSVKYTPRTTPRATPRAASSRATPKTVTRNTSVQPTYRTSVSGNAGVSTKATGRASVKATPKSTPKPTPKPNTKGTKNASKGSGKTAHQNGTMLYENVSTAATNMMVSGNPLEYSQYTNTYYVPMTNSYSQEPYVTSGPSGVGSGFTPNQGYIESSTVSNTSNYTASGSYVSFTSSANSTNTTNIADTTGAYADLITSQSHDSSFIDSTATNFPNVYDPSSSQGQFATSSFGTQNEQNEVVYSVLDQQQYQYQYQLHHSHNNGQIEAENAYVYANTSNSMTGSLYPTYSAENEITSGSASGNPNTERVDSAFVFNNNMPLPQSSNLPNYYETQQETLYSSSAVTDKIPPNDYASSERQEQVQLYGESYDLNQFAAAPQNHVPQDEHFVRQDVVYHNESAIQTEYLAKTYTLDESQDQTRDQTQDQTQDQAQRQTYSAIPSDFSARTYIANEQVEYAYNGPNTSVDAVSYSQSHLFVSANAEESASETTGHSPNIREEDPANNSISGSDPQFDSSAAFADPNCSTFLLPTTSLTNDASHTKVENETPTKNSTRPREEEIGHILPSPKRMKIPEHSASPFFTTDSEQIGEVQEQLRAEIDSAANCGDNVENEADTQAK